MCVCVCVRGVARCGDGNGNGGMEHTTSVHKATATQCRAFVTLSPLFQCFTQAQTRVETQSMALGTSLNTQHTQHTQHTTKQKHQSLPAPNQSRGQFDLRYCDVNKSRWPAPRVSPPRWHMVSWQCGGAPQRWRQVSVGLVVLLVSGTQYSAALVAPALRSAFNLSRDDAGLLRSLANLGPTFGAASGFAFDRLGPRRALWLAAVLTGLGYAVQAMLVASRSWRPDDDDDSTGSGSGGGDSGAGDGNEASTGTVAALMLLTVVWGTGSTFSDVTGVGSALHFPKAFRGRMIGVLKATYGLSASFVSVFFVSFFSDDPQWATWRFLLTVGAVCAGVFLLASLVVHTAPPGGAAGASAADRRRYYATAAGIVVMGTYLASVAGVQHEWVEHHSVSAHAAADDAVAAVAVLLAACLGFLAVQCSCASRPATAQHALTVAPDEWDSDGVTGASAGSGAGVPPAAAAPDVDDYGTATTPSGAHNAAAAASDSDVDKDTQLLIIRGATAAASTEPPPPASLTELFCQVEYMLLLLAFAGSVSVELVFIANVSEVVESWGGVDHTVFVTAFSVCNGLGRLLAGWTADTCSRFVSRPLQMAGAVVLATVASACMVLTADLGALLVVSILYGLACGSEWTLHPAIVADIWPQAAFGKVYNTVAALPPIIAITLDNTLLTAVYDANADVDASGGVCRGRRCFAGTFAVALGLNVVAFACCVLLHRRVVQRNAAAATRRGSSGTHELPVRHVGAVDTAYVASDAAVVVPPPPVPL